MHRLDSDETVRSHRRAVNGDRQACGQLAQRFDHVGDGGRARQQAQLFVAVRGEQALGLTPAGPRVAASLRCGVIRCGCGFGGRTRSG